MKLTSMAATVQGRIPVLLLASLPIALGLLVACGPDTSTPTVLTAPEGGQAADGKAAIAEYGCGTCHSIPGVAGANGVVAPPLDRFAKRHYIAGAVTNSSENLVQWLIAPESIEPGTAMPAVGLTGQEARDIAAYLSTLK